MNFAKEKTPHNKIRDSKVMIVDDDESCGKMLLDVIDNAIGSNGVDIKGFIGATPERKFLRMLGRECIRDKIILIVDYTAIGEWLQAICNKISAANMDVRLNEEETDGLYTFKELLKRNKIHIILMTGRWDNKTLKICEQVSQRTFHKPLADKGHTISDLSQHIKGVLTGEVPFYATEH